MPDKRAAHRIAQAKIAGRARQDPRRSSPRHHRRAAAAAAAAVPRHRRLHRRAARRARRASSRPRWCSTSAPTCRGRPSTRRPQRHGMTVVGAQPSAITGGTLYHLPRAAAACRSPTSVRALEAERVGIASPNYVYRIVQDTASDTSSAAGDRPSNTSSRSCSSPRSTRSRPATRCWSR